jgi:hypothetical protein
MGFSSAGQIIDDMLPDLRAVPEGYRVIVYRSLIKALAAMDYDPGEARRGLDPTLDIALTEYHKNRWGDEDDHG